MSSREWRLRRTQRISPRIPNQVGQEPHFPRCLWICTKKNQHFHPARFWAYMCFLSILPYSQMPLLNFLPRMAAGPPMTRSTGFIISCSVATTLALIALAQYTLQTARPRLIRSPRVTLLPNLSEAEQSKLAYPPDVLPGARDVDSPVGHVQPRGNISVLIDLVRGSMAPLEFMNGDLRRGGKFSSSRELARRV
jgi:hypothetical protein